MELSIELADGAEQCAFAVIMAELVRENLKAQREKERDFHAMCGRVALFAEDAEVSITLHFQRGRLRVYEGLHGIPDLTIRGASELLIDLSRVPSHPRFAALPDPRSQVTRSLVRALRERRLRFGGIASHAGLALKLSRILSIH
jgi:hypothetical protein